MIRLFKHYISHAVFLVGVLDVVLLYLAGDLSWRLRAEQIGMDPGSIADRFWQLAGQAGVMLGAMIAVGQRQAQPNWSTACAIWPGCLQSIGSSPLMAGTRALRRFAPCCWQLDLWNFCS
ncbi:hypothetical protein RQP55_05865 [Novosphingobium sp. APW14]|uniref:hypothetical protein n=1 Tax=Novosphingobium sp. APW14 TaxID=3077237 RepID=UPI0028DF3A5B|nr:hypothetical protein [Novosphingobium sp. APW14]MDT9012953.1 hypothetical protein [Novosphingobium sp. APW14]